MNSFFTQDEGAGPQASAASAKCTSGSDEADQGRSATSATGSEETAKGPAAGDNAV